MSAERDERLVTSFADLRAGDLIVIYCRRCGQKHRGILTRLEHGFLHTIRQGRIETPYWCFEPEALHESGRRVAIPPDSVEARVVFRVDTGLDPAEEEHQASLDRLHASLPPEVVSGKRRAVTR